MQQFRIASMFSALLIVLLHSFIPHKHHSDLSSFENEQIHAEATGILDYLSLAFHFDTGGEQLEEYTVADSDVDEGLQLMEFIPVAVVNFNPVLPIEEERVKFKNKHDDNQGRLAVQKNSLRGPPAIS